MYPRLRPSCSRRSNSSLRVVFIADISSSIIAGGSRRSLVPALLATNPCLLHEPRSHKHGGPRSLTSTANSVPPLRPLRYLARVRSALDHFNTYTKQRPFGLHNAPPACWLRSVRSFRAAGPRHADRPGSADDAQPGLTVTTSAGAQGSPHHHTSVCDDNRTRCRFTSILPANETERVVDRNVRSCTAVRRLAREDQRDEKAKPYDH
jgi:hypothetical protein